MKRQLELARRVLAIETTQIDTVVLARAVLAQDEELQALKRMSTSCPCHHTTPCSDMCSCARPLMSAGCRRCASYGSDEQRQGAARRLAAQDEEIERLRAALTEVLAMVQMHSEDYDYVSPRGRVEELRAMVRG